MKKVILLFAVALCCFKPGYCQPGSLDSSFGTDGIVKTDLGYKITAGTNITNVLLQSDNSSYAIFQTYYQNFILKNLPDGSRDSAYGENGFSSPLYFRPNNAILQPDGKMVLVGGGFDISRFNTNGTPDSTFSDDGLQTTDFNSSYSFASRVAVQKDGKIVVAGLSEQNFALARYNANGSLDSSFSNDGKFLTDFLSYFSDGVCAITIQNDGKIVIAGSISAITNTPDFVVARYNADGSTDSSFSEDGKQTTDFNSWSERATSITIQDDGKIVVAGTIEDYEFAIVRYNADGSPDNKFGKDGKQIAHLSDYERNESSSIAIQTDGKILVAGFAEKEGRLSDFALVRFKTNGSLDSSFSDDGWQTTDFDSLNNTADFVAIQDNGKVVVAGASSIPGQSVRGNVCIARYNANGSLDNTFNDNGKINRALSFKEGNTEYTSAAIQKDGKIVAAGHTQKAINEQEYFVIRYNVDGSIDSNFASNGKQTVGLEIAAIAIQPDGKILVQSGKSGDEVIYSLSRYNTNGRLDSSFADDGILSQDFQITSLDVQNDGKIVVEGFGSVQENNILKLVRYNSDGTIDSSFSNDGTRNVDFLSASPNDAIAIQSNGKILAAGITGYNYGNYNIALGRLNSDGSLDSSFSDDGIQTTFFVGTEDVTSLAVGNNGKIAVGGFNHNQNLSSFIAVFNSDGSLDSSFSGDGKLLQDFGNGISSFQSVAIEDDGKIAVCTLAGSNSTSTGSISVITRYNINGNLDSGFGKNGIVISDNFDPKNIIVNDNKLYAVGSGTDGPFGGGVFGAVGRYLLEIKTQTSPIVSLTTPADNATYLAPAAHIKLNAEASDADGTISKVEFYNGSALLDLETAVPYSYVWKSVPLGNYTLTAKAYDDSGNVTISAPVHISVVPNKPPLVSIVKPVNNQSYSAPAYIHFEAAASDTDGRITRVEFYNGSTLLRTEYKYPYTYVWRNVPEGNYTITAVATDNWGAQTTSKSITVRVRSASAIVSSKPYAAIEKTALHDALSLMIIPNPASNNVNIYTSGLRQNKPATLSIISASGIALKTMLISNAATQLDVSSLASGVYMINIVSGDKILYKQFVKL